MTAAMACLAACGSMNKKQQTALISVISSHDIEFLSINGTELDAATTTAVVVMGGQNQVVFRWPRQAEDFKIPAIYQITAQLVGGQEYSISTDKTSHLPCIFKVDKLDKKAAGETAIACAVRR